MLKDKKWFWTIFIPSFLLWLGIVTKIVLEYF